MVQFQSLCDTIRSLLPLSQINCCNLLSLKGSHCLPLSVSPDVNLLCISLGRDTFVSRYTFTFHLLTFSRHESTHHHFGCCRCSLTSAWQISFSLCVMFFSCFEETHEWNNETKIMSVTSLMDHCHRLRKICLVVFNFNLSRV